MSIPSQFRLNFYTIIHKCIRLELYQFAIDLGKSDFELKQMPDLQRKFSIIKTNLLSHSQTEDKYLHPFIKKYLSKEILLIEAEHEQLDAQLEALNDLLKKMVDEPSIEARQILGTQLYLEYNFFVASFIRHLHAEEYEIMPKLWAHCTDQQLSKPHINIMRDISPQKMCDYKQRLYPAISSKEKILIA